MHPQNAVKADNPQHSLSAASSLPTAPDFSLKDLDGNASYDLTGSYGVNLLGYDFYKDCIDAGIERVRSLGPLLGSSFTRRAVA